MYSTTKYFKMQVSWVPSQNEQINYDVKVDINIAFKNTTKHKPKFGINV